ncbi:protein of unknown function [Candidatus Filomicrobium marinum]|uniref:Uncharacterized protein n=1 Tax=Candidatus Filomicrobium marinum TaxID=1608628 RepID=A0A0D6JCR4_9HYPH|nr:protein of unknown function [Candidatus Filomicrobium marinum]CPR17463.1 protein of unknown function [Candidatus Filomicrobium marinum]
MNHSGKIAQYCQQDVDPKLQAETDFEKYCDGREEDSKKNAQEIAHTVVVVASMFNQFSHCFAVISLVSREKRLRTEQVPRRGSLASRGNPNAALDA